ncbi:MAG: hypothetical protein KDD51_07875 [Bdellovibrionales bacterium]|nr:hypothetical protein [Bdellovibrionales bacterium]
MKKLWLLSVAVMVLSVNVMAEGEQPTSQHAPQGPAVTQQQPGQQYQIDPNAASQAEVASLIQKANACILEREAKKGSR